MFLPVKNFPSRLKNALLERARVYLTYRDDPLMRSWHYRHARRLRRFKNLHAGESCFIIGNGPSLNEMDLSGLKDCHTFGLNKIYLIFDRVDLNLSYHVAVNRLVIKQSIEAFRALNCPSFLSYKAAFDLTKTGESKFFYLATEGPYTFQRDIASPMHEGHTVTFVAMQVAYYMGFKNIYLIGIDHNFFSEDAPNEQRFLKGDDPYHFDPRYFQNKDWNLPNREASELSYYLARYFFRRDGRNIYDATAKGKLDIFPKIDYEKALRQIKVEQ